MCEHFPLPLVYLFCLIRVVFSLVSMSKSLTNKTRLFCLMLNVYNGIYYVVNIIYATKKTNTDGPSSSPIYKELTYIWF